MPIFRFNRLPSSSSVLVLFASILSLSASAQTQTATPVMTPVAGTYNQAQTITITDSTPGAAIYYTTAYAVTPTTSSTPYTGPFSVNCACTVAAIAVAPGYSTSAVGRAYYAFRVAEPNIASVAGPGAGTVTVTLSETTPGAALYYTLDGTTPTTSSPLYGGPLAITSAATINTQGTLTGYQNSTVNKRTVGPVTVAPVVTPTGGTFYGPQQVTITDSTPNAAIYYSNTYGVAPVVGTNPYTGPITVNSTGTIAAIAVAPGYLSSAIGSSYLTLKAATPQLSPSSGTFATPVNVSIAESTPGTTVYYTTDGTTPTSASSQYAAPVNIANNATLKAVAQAPGYAGSSLSAGTYMITPAPPAPIVAFGDSLTCGGQGSTSSGTPLGSVPASLATDLSVPVVNEGVSGNTSTQIAIRQGGIPTSVTMAGNQIPPSGSVTVTFPAGYEPVTAPGGNLGAYCYPTFLAKGTHGTIAGVPGTVTILGSVYSFTRDTSGSAVSVPSGTPFVVDEPYLNYFQIINSGRNNYNNLNQVISEDAAMVAILPNPKQFVVTSIINGNLPNEYCLPAPTGNCAAIRALNSAKAAANPNNYVDIWTPLLDSYNPSFPLDVIDYNNGVVPTSLHAIWTGTTSASCSANATACCVTGQGPTVGDYGYFNQTSGNPYSSGAEYFLITGTESPGICTSGVEMDMTRGIGGTTPVSTTKGAYWGFWDAIHLNGGSTNPGNPLGSGYGIQAQAIQAWYLANVL